MHRTLSLKIGELNSYLKCPICNGYLIDSYTINECLHSFCKSCIIKYIKRKECCPVCKINIIKDRMSLFLKRDVNLQCIVYKIVPELFKKEMKRRRDFYSTHPKALKFLKKKKILDKEAIGELDDDIFMLDDYRDISLSIEYSETGMAEIRDSIRNKELDPTIPRIYLQCPASLSIELLKKFLSIKFDVKTEKLDVMYDDKPLKKDLTLLDVSYIYAWRRTAPMRLFYRVNKELKQDEFTEQAAPNILTSIENKAEKLEETNDKGEDIKNLVEINKTFDENMPPNNVEDSLNKPTAKSTPQKELTQNDTQSRLQIDLSVNNDSKENSFKNNSTIPNSHLTNQINTSQNLNPNTENLTITAMVASITKSATNNLNKLETVSNSDKENEEEMSQVKIEVASIPDPEVKPKKPKPIKSKKESDTVEEQPDLSKKKKTAKTNDNNPTKKPKIEEKHEPINQFNMPFSNKINSQPAYSANTQTQNLPMLQNFQFMPLMYPWNYTQNYQQTQPHQSQQNNMNQAFLNQKYASQIFDLFQNKSQPYQNYYAQTQSNSQLQPQYNNQVNPNHHFNQFNYMDDFKKPLASFASFIQEAASYQNNLFNNNNNNNSNSNGSKLVNGQVNENSASLDSLKETQLKISESCSLVND